MVTHFDVRGTGQTTGREMKIGVVCEPDSVNACYRALIPARKLETRGHTIVWPTDPVEIPLRALATCDLVHCYRRMDKLADLRRLAQLGVAISFDNDDNYLAAEVSNGGTGMKGRRYNRGLFGLVREAALLADVATTTTHELERVYLAAGIKRVAVIDNYLDETAFGFGSSQKHDGVVIAWVAGPEHSTDLRRIPIVRALEDVLARHPHVRVLGIGLDLRLRSERYRHVRAVAFDDLQRVLAGVDIGIAPLADTAFNRCRSAVKLKEYASGGAAWLASPVGPYRELGPEQGGQLVGDESWFEALDDLVVNSRQRRRLVKRAVKWAKSETIARHIESWEKLFVEVSELAASRMRGNRAAAGC